MSLFPDSNKPNEKPIGLSREDFAVGFDIRYSIIQYSISISRTGPPRGPPYKRALQTSPKIMHITSPLKFRSNRETERKHGQISL